jgi:hypothetical protein
MANIGFIVLFSYIFKKNWGWGGQGQHSLQAMKVCISIIGGGCFIL